MTTTERPTRSLVPFLPRVTVEWARTPDASPWQLIDGSLLFVDISGFTKMSERLARHGKLGAEEVTDAIETCFDALLALAYAAGGSLLKFGGDALLLLFTGERHADPGGDDGVAMHERLATSAGSTPAPGASCCACPPACTPARSGASSSASPTAS